MKLLPILSSYGVIYTYLVQSEVFGREDDCNTQFFQSFYHKLCRFSWSPVSRMDALSNQAMVFRFCHLPEEQETVTLTNQNQSGSLGVLFESTWIHSRSIFQTLFVSVKTFRQILPIFRRFSARLEGCHRFSGFSNAAKGKHVSLYRFV